MARKPLLVPFSLGQRAAFAVTAPMDNNVFSLQEVGWSFRVDHACEIECIEFQISTLSIVEDLHISLRSPQANSYAPSATVDEFVIHTPTAGWNVTGPITDDGTNGGVRRVLAANELVCVVIDWLAAVGSLVIQYGSEQGWAPKGRAYKKLNPAGGAGTFLELKHMLHLAVKLTDGTYLKQTGMMPRKVESSHTFSSSSSPDEYAYRFTVPMDMTLRGARIQGDFDGPFDVILYGPTDTILGTTSYTADDRATAHTGDYYVELPTDVSLQAGLVYRLAIKPTSTTSLTVLYADVETAALMAAMPMGAEHYQSSRTDGGAWTDLATRRLWVDLFFTTEVPLSPSVFNSAGVAAVAFVGAAEITTTQPLDGYVIIEMCFGVAPSGKLGYRNWIREHPNVIAHWFLSDVGLPGLYGAEDEIYPNDAGEYINEPAKGRGLLPEFGLSTRFNGADQAVEVDYDDFAGVLGSGPFTFIALVRPRTVTFAADRCIHQSGTSGGYLGLDATGHFTFGQNGGAKTTLSQVVEAEGEYLVIGTYNGSTAALHVFDLIAFQAGVWPRKRGALLGTSSASVSIGPHGGSDAFIGKRASEEFNGDIQGVACIGAALDGTEILEIAECAIWTEVTPDTRSTVPISTSRGLFSDKPDTRVSPVGSATFAMNNAENNTGSTRSWYSPNHANCRQGFDRGTPVRISFGNEFIGSRIQFLGALSEILPSPGIYADRLTYCTAFDWMEEAARFNLQGIETQEAIRADEVLKLIIGLMPNKPHELALFGGSDIYPVALDNTNDENAFAQTEFSRLALSELGLIYVTGPGIFVFEPRTYRSALVASAHQFDNDMSGSKPDASKDRVINQARVTVHPKKVDVAPTTVLFESTTRLALDHGLETETFLQFRDPNQLSARFGGLDVVYPLPTTHYTINEAEDGSGANLTANPLITLLFRISGSGVYMIANNQYGQRVYIAIQILGKGVYDFEPVTVIEKNEDSIRSIGVSEIHIDMPYQSLVPLAQGAALQILNVFQDHVTRLISMQFPARKAMKYLNATMNGEISTRMWAAEEMSGVNGDFFINGIKVEWRQDQEIITEWYLTPADMQQYWIMDESALDITTRLGFA